MIVGGGRGGGGGGGGGRVIERHRDGDREREREGDDMNAHMYKLSILDDDSPSDMEGHPAAGLVARHDCPIASLVLLSLLFTDIACLEHRDIEVSTSTCTCTMTPFRRVGPL